jgi:hypothetical protein
MANAYCERVIGTIRRECLDYLIPLNERHLTRPWGPVFRNRLRQLFLPVPIDIDCRRGTVLRRRQCSAAYIMNIAWSRGLLNSLEYFQTTGRHGVYRQVRAARAIP